MGQVYSATRAIVYASKGDDQDAIDSLFAIFGPAGSAVRTIRDSGAFDEHDVHTEEWVGDKRSAYSIPEDYFQGHLFDTSKFLYLFNDVPSESVLDLFQLSREDISTIESECTNVPAFKDGSTEFSYFDAINTNVVLTWGQSDLTATNAPVGRSVHWMGCVFSFGAGWGSSQSISFCC